LVRALGIPSLIAFGIGGIIGTGIFVLTGLAAASMPAPPSSFPSSSPASAACSPDVLFRVCRDGAGRRQRLCLQLRDLGEVIAWFVGWNLMLEYMMACSTVAVGWSRYFVKLLDHYGINFIPAG
jgi:APA family basic amino acid/polyamine antiporter